MTRTQFSYTPGGVTGVCGPHAAALVALAPTDPLVTELARVAATTSDVADLVEVLVSSGLRRVTDFAVVARSGEASRVVVRGSFRVLVTGSPAISGSGLWNEVEVRAGADLVLASGGETADHASPSLPLGGGVVLASRILLAGAGEESPDPSVPPAPPQAVATSASPPEPAVVEPVVVEPEAREPETPGPEASEPGTPESEAPEPEAPEPDASGTAAGQGFDHLFGPTSSLGEMAEPAADADADADAEPGPSAVPPPTAAASPATAAPRMPPVDRPQDFGMTLEAAVTGEVPEERPAEFISAVPQQFPPAPPPPPVGPPALIEALPWMEQDWRPPAAAAQPVPASPMAAPPVAPQPAPPPAVDPMTVDRRQLVESGAVGPMVAAARCRNGHLSPAHAGTCRVCRQPLPAQPPFEVPRPPLGELRLSSGETITLDRGVIMGRNPRLPSDYVGEQPHLVQLNDPNRDVSAVHLEVRLDQWNVLVRDLGSTNGTEVTLPGRQPIALRPHDPIVIEPGTEVVLAQVLGFVFEVVG